MTTFVDTSAFFAVLDADDQMHSTARREWERLLETDTTFRTTNYVLVETSALLQARIGMDALQAFAADMRRLRINDIFCFDPHFSQQGFQVPPK